jgi:hypothetical protein
MKSAPSVVMGLLLVAIGGMLFLQNLGLIDFAWRIFWALAFTAGGIACLVLYLSAQDYWWAAVPAFILLAIGTLSIWPDRLGENLGGAFFLGAIGLSFATVYLRRAEYWWAVIPAGGLFTLAVVAALGNILHVQTGGIFFLGLAATFGAVYALPTPHGRMDWALIPAGVLFVLGLIVMAATTLLLRISWPALLILAGGHVIYRALRRQRN